MDNFAIRIHDVSKTYKIYQRPIDRLKESLDPFKKNRHTNFQALKKLSLDIPPGSTVGFLGHNGAGKSTLMRIIAGGLTPSTGHVEIRGKISFLSLGQGFNTEYSGLTNIYLGARMLGFSDVEINAKLQSIIDFSELGEFIDHPVKTYSAGMYSRLAFAIAISFESEILVIDEVLSVGDIRFTYKCYEALKSYKKLGRTVLLVTHDVSAVINYCDTAVWLKDGAVKQAGVAKDVAQNYYNYMTYGAISDLTVNVPTIPTPTVSDADDHTSALKEQGFGIRGAVFKSIQLTNIETNKPISSVAPYDKLIFSAVIETKETLSTPILSIHFANEFGLLMFGLNNEQYDKIIPPLKANCSYKFNFKFTFPLLKNGTYFIHIGIVDGNYPAQHQHHVINEVLTIHSSSTFRPASTYTSPIDNFEMTICEE